MIKIHKIVEVKVFQYQKNALNQSSTIFIVLTINDNIKYDWKHNRND